MHLSSLEKMRDFTARHLADAADRPLEILDLGSADIGGTYAQFFDNPKWNYRGVDLAPGPNIHVVLSNPYNWRELPTHCADVFISGQTFEHIEFFWLTMLEIARVLKPGGLCCIIAPSRGPIHRYPVDCWRFYPDGFAALARYADLEILEILHDGEDCPSSPDKSEEWGDLVLVARKKENKSTASSGYIDISPEAQMNAQRAHLQGQIDRQRAEFEESRRELERDLALAQTLVREKQTEIEITEERCQQTQELLRQRENLLREIKTRPWRVLWRHLKKRLQKY